MAYTFNADEVFEIAERIEVNGGKFYRRAAEMIEDAEAKELMLRLAAMEDDHERFFSALRAQAKKNDGEDLGFDPDGEAAAYLQAFADGHVFDVSSDVSEKFKGVETVEEIIRTAIGFEKDAIVFFLGIKSFVPEWLGKDKINELIKEEQRHIVILTNALKAINKEAD